MKIVYFFILLLFSYVLPSYSQSELVYDYILKDAEIFDGENFSSFKADIGIIRDEIYEIDDLSNAEAFEVIEAEGLAVAPGFIDAHTHSDFNPLIYPNLPNKVMQGVTTEVTGNCGMSAAPIFHSFENHIHSVWSREGVQIPEKLEWREYGEYREKLEEVGLYHNMVGLIGHGNVRAGVMGMDPKVASTSEILEMKRRVGDAMKQGASGISFGLVYLPGIFANEEEVVQLCREAARHSGVCAFHMRSEGSGLVEAVREVLRVGKKAQARIQISHFKVGGGKKNWHLIEEAFQLIEEARTNGQEVVADAYPYIAGYAELGVVLPDALYTREDRLSLFRNKLKERELLDQLREYYELRKMKWNWIMIAATPYEKYQKFEGKTIKQIARRENREPEQFLIDILGDTNFEVSAFYFSQSPEVVSRVLRKSYVSVGSDSVADGSRRPHPRAFGSFPKILAKYVREEKELRLGEAIHKMTALPAKQFRLKKRGKIQKGFYADLVLFDANKVRDQADYENPTKGNIGIEWVFINGKPVVREGQLVEIKEGRFLTL